MKNKLKKLIIPFIMMVIFDLGIYYLTLGKNFGGGYSPHVGILLISGLLLGPYGAIGSVFGNLLCDLIRGYNIPVCLSSAIVSFGVSYLAYKLWYDSFNDKIKITKPTLNSTNHIILFFEIIIICGALYSILHTKLFYLTYPDKIADNTIIGVSYFVNFINSSFIFGIIGIWLAKRFNFFQTPQTSKKKGYKNLYLILRILLIISMVIILIIDYIFNLNNSIVITELIVILILLFAYLTKPFTSKIYEETNNSIAEIIMNRFFATILILTICIIFLVDTTLIKTIQSYIPITAEDIIVSLLFITDILLLIFLIPSLSVLRYFENKIINPITKFSQIENFVKENEKIESKGLLNIYSEYIHDENEIGVLARSYSDLIKHNNYYIENIQKIEGEKERIKAELDIATKIQKSHLPVDAIENNNFFVNGYSKPAKEVGGDFFDYYNIDDDNLAIVIGDASGKGVPAALLAAITQVMIKQSFNHESDPSKILYSLNNQLFENNDEGMFITIWLGVYNKNSKKITFANGGHNPPLIKIDNKFKFLDMNHGIVLGVIEDFEYIKDELNFTDELVLYTDGITDASNNYGKMYGENRLLNFFNGFKSDNDPIKPLLNNIKKFVENKEQFDDMTILYLKIKDY